MDWKSSYLLDQKLAEGGMGEVWRAVDSQAGCSVAVKILRPQSGSAAATLADFENEIEAIARLEHPGIVRVLDAGSSERCDRLEGIADLPAGSAFLVMEFAELGSLAAFRTRLDWNKLLEVLEQLLGALAHAHSRGIIHRDIKPGNVLVWRWEDAGVSVKLTDFGIAQLTDKADAVLGVSGGTRELPTGTVEYMSPEQLQGAWRDYGPWTDIYALGAMTWELVTGSTPFAGTHVMQVALAHLRNPLPTLRPRFTIPDGLKTWLENCLAKLPNERYQHAQDALYELRRLCGVGEPARAVPEARVGATRAVPESGAGEPYDGRFERTLRLGEVHESGGIAAVAIGPERTGSDTPPGSAVRGLGLGEPAEPDFMRFEDVRRSSPAEARDVRLRNGLGTFRFRTPPLVGREAEQRLLWNELRTVVSTSVPRVVVLRGEAGVGKSRLAQWLAECADETGLASPWLGRFDRGLAPGAGLGRMIARRLRTTGMSPERTAARIAEVLGAAAEYDASLVDDVVEFVLRAQNGSTAGSGRTMSPMERCVLIARLTTALGRGRPTILWLEDTHWSMDAMELLRFFAAADAPVALPAVMLVATVRDEILAERGPERLALERLPTHDRVRTITLAKLDDAAIGDAIRAQLELAPDIERKLIARANGRPLIVRQMLAAWVESGAVHRGPSGYSVADARLAELPDSIHEMWSHRIQTTPSTRSPQVWRVISQAAALGLDFSMDEWSTVADESAPWIPPAVEALTRIGVARVSDGLFHWSEPTFRDSVERTSRDEGRWAGVCSIVAKRLKDATPAGTRGFANRLASLFIAAGEARNAFDALTQAAGEAIAGSDYADAIRLLESRLPFMPSLNPDERLVAEYEDRFLRADVLRLMWNFDEADALARRLDTEGGPEALGVLQRRALVLKSQLARQQGRLNDALEFATRALDRAMSSADKRNVGAATLALAAANRARGEVASAAVQYSSACTIFGELGDSRGLANAVLGLAHLERQRGHADDAATLYERALHLFVELGNRQEQANCQVGLAELARFAGELERAEIGYRRARELFDLVGSRDVLVVDINLALIEIGRGQHALALGRLQRIDSLVSGGQRSALRLFARAFQLAPLAALGDLSTLRAIGTQVAEMLRDSGVVDRDILAQAELAIALMGADSSRSELSLLRAIAATQVPKSGA